MKGLPGYLAYRVLSGLFGLLPAPLMRSMGRGLGWCASFVARDRFAMAMRHQVRVQGPDVDARRAARRVFVEYGRYWAEVFWARPRRARGMLERTSIVGIEHLHAARDSGRGVVVALPHLGNWEVAGLRAQAEQVRALAVAEDLGNERIVQWFIRLRALMEIDVLIARRGARVTGQLLARLDEGGLIALPSDRDIKGKGIAVEFFGEMTTLPAGPAALAERTGAVLLPVGTYFGPRGTFVFVIEPPLPISDGDTREERVAGTTQELARVFERIIRREPEQWHLLQPNWPSDRR